MMLPYEGNEPVTAKNGVNLSERSLLLTLLTNATKRGISYAVLTPYTGYPPGVDSDVDVALSSDPRSTIEPILLELQKQGEIDILQRLHYEVPSGYYYILRVCRSNDLKLLHLDCLYDPYGISRYAIPTTSLVAGCVKEWWGYRANDTDLAVYYLTKRIVKSELSKDQFIELREVLKRAEKLQLERKAKKHLGNAAGDLVKKIFISTTVDEAQSVLSRFRRDLSKRYWKHPVWWFQRNAYEFIRLSLRLLRPTGLFVVLLGPDGCGKSTLAEALHERLSRAYRRTWRFHWRPGLLPKLSRRDARPTCFGFVEPPREAAYGTLVSLARYLYYLADFVVGYWVRVYPRKAATSLVIGERWHYDVIVNPQRYGFHLPRWLLQMGQRLIPKPDLIFFLTAKPEMIHGRKPELTVEEIQTQIDEFREILANEPGVVEVDTDQGISETVQFVQSVILKETSHITARRLGIKSQWSGFGRSSDPKVWLHRNEKVAHALRLYRPSSVTGRLAKFVASHVPRRISGRLFFHSFPSLEKTAELKRHMHVIRRTLNDSKATVSFGTGTPGPHRKIVAQVTSGNLIRAYVKIANETATAELLDTEARALSALVSATGSTFQFPTLIADVCEGNYRYLFLSAAGEGGRPRHLNPDRLDQLFLSYWMDQTSLRISVDEILSKVPSLLGEDGVKGQMLADAKDFLREAFRDQEVRVWPSHGDYAPWNTLLLRDGTLYVFDWEYFNQKAPALQDVFHRIFMPARLVERLTPAQIVERVLALRADPILGPVMVRSELGDEDLHAYFILYLLRLLSRRGSDDESFVNFVIEGIRFILGKAGFGGYRKKVLVSAYACEPGKGSEPGVGWNWVRAISQNADAWVITKANNKLPIEKELGTEPNSYLHFEYVELPRWLSFWKKGQRGVRLYYYLWQFAALIRARRLLRSNTFNLAHHVTFVNDWVWTFLSLLPIPFIWGPMGSHPKFPRPLLQSPRSWLQNAARCSFQSMVRLLDPLYWISVLRAKKILCINQAVAQWFPLRVAGRRKIIIEPAIGVEDISEGQRSCFSFYNHEDNALRVLFMGRFVAMKGPDIALEAFSEFASINPDARLGMIGDGPLAGKLQQQAVSLNIADKVSFISWLPREKALKVFQTYDVFLFPSMEGGGWSFWKRWLPVFLLSASILGVLVRW